MSRRGPVAAVVPAAGRGERLGPGTPKALRMLGAVPMLAHAVRGLAESRLVSLVVVAAPPGGVSEVKASLAGYDMGADLRVVEGGATRRQSVHAALGSLPDEVDVVLVHDAARPLAPAELVDAVVGAVHAGADAVVPVLPVVDTVKRVDPDGRVVETLDRSVLRSVQTPQGFRRAVLARAHAETGTDATDDAGLVERLGVPVHTVPGSDEAFKVTRPLDLVLAQAVLARRRPVRGF